MISPMLRPVADTIRRTRSAVDSYFDIDRILKSGQEPVHTFEEAKAKMILSMVPVWSPGCNYFLTCRSLISGYAKLHSTKDALTPESADALLERGLRPSKCGKGYVFTRDLKHMVRSLYAYPMDVWKEFAKAIVCPHLIVTAISKPPYFDEGNQELLILIAGGDMNVFCFVDVSKEVMGFYETNNPKFYHRPTEGNHFLHLNNPDRVVPHVEELLKNHPASSTKNSNSVPQTANWTL